MPSHYLNQCWNIVIGPVGTNFSEILIGIDILSFKKMHLKMSGKWQLFCLSLNVFIMYNKVSYLKLTSNWRTAVYKSSSKSPPTVLLNKTCMSDVTRHVAHSIRITCSHCYIRKKSINWNLSQYQKTTFQGIPTVNIRQPGDCLIENRALAFRE